MLLKKSRRYSKKAEQEWVHTKPVVTKTSLLIKSYQVMQRWEDNYMKSLASITTSRGGNVLEVGFGLGISAGYIQRSKKIESHTVIEAHPDVAGMAQKKFSREIRTGRMKIIRGFWEDATKKIESESFDGILFDSCPLDEPVEFFQFLPFFKEAYRLLKKGGVLTYFSDEHTRISDKHLKELKKAGFQDIKYKLCGVRPPKKTEYWKHRTIVTPIVTKT